MAKYLGPNQLAECMRSGIKCLASELVRDGRNPHLLVLPRYADPAHPQERPFKPDDAEGRARFPIAPDHGFDVNPVLSAPADQPSLTWTQAKTIGPRVERYDVYRRTSAGAFTLQTSLAVEFEGPADYDWIHPTSWDDPSTTPDTQYTYRVDAVTQDERTLSSNTVLVTVGEADSSRLLEDGSFRLLESGDNRLLE